jgi:hypothetical protein
MMSKLPFPTAKALTEGERWTCPGGHGEGDLPGGVERGIHPGGHLQPAGGNNLHGKGFFPAN